MPRAVPALSGIPDDRIPDAIIDTIATDFHFFVGTSSLYHIQDHELVVGPESHLVDSVSQGRASPKDRRA